MAQPTTGQLPIRAFQWDLARQVERLDFLKKQLPRYAEWGYQELYLHLEDAVHFPSVPGIGRADAYTHAELGELVSAATKAHVGVVPIVNFLGHTQYLIKHPDWRDLNELRDEVGGPLSQGQVCPLHPRLPELAAKLLADIAPFCTAGKVHVGLDESFHLGKCPRCREEVARIGLGGHFAGHVQRLKTPCDALGLQMGIWADMLYFVPEAIKLLPRGIIAYDWYYYSFAKKPRVEFFNFAERDLAPALRKQGISYYGCPMNGAFRYEPLPVFGDRLANIRSWWQRCAAVAAEGFLVTSWEPNRLALETTTAVDAAAASLWLEPELDDATSLLSRGLERVFRLEFARPMARLLLAADQHAFAGYARWQINDRWDIFAGSQNLKSFHVEERFFARELARARREHWPATITASLAFRLYLAQRDLFVREAARDLFHGRRLLTKGDSTGVIQVLKQSMAGAADFRRFHHAGLTAARAMWARTRDSQTSGPNEQILNADAHRLSEWRHWLGQATKRPEMIMGPSPLCGAWQLQFIVHNFAPAVQKVIVEQRASDGSWQELASRFTIEFRAQAARPNARIKREFIVPLNSPAQSLRIALRGVGQVSISHVTLTDGVASHRAASYAFKHTLGRRAPKKGFPSINWLQNRADMILAFAATKRKELRQSSATDVRTSGRDEASTRQAVRPISGPATQGEPRGLAGSHRESPTRTRRKTQE